MYFFTSDLHFNDDENVKFDMRPFKNAKRFDKFVIKTWNRQANENDTIYIVGDFVDCDKDGESKSWEKSILYVKKIKAQVVLIMGNNEERVVKYFFDNDFEKFRDYCLSIGFKEVYKSTIVSFNGNKFNLVHKPIDCNKNMLNLFGHVHRSGGLYKPFGINVGCDLNHFRLFSEKDIMFFLDLKKKYWDNDKSLNMW